MFESYTEYKKSIIDRLIAASGKSGKWSDGIWDQTESPVAHILPLEGENTKENRVLAIKKFLHFDCKDCLPRGYRGLHQYAHHLNSSQLLCMMFFSSMIKDGKASDTLVKLIHDILNIQITTSADCQFEYKDNNCPDYFFYIHNEKGQLVKRYEGTSFDFHIKGNNNTEIFFEIKLTEQGFGKAEDNSRHREKAIQYISLLPKAICNKVTIEKFLSYYQILRNVMRTRSDKAYVVFISDKNNPATENDKHMFIDEFGLPERVSFITWQDIIENSPLIELPFQLKII